MRRFSEDEWVVVPAADFTSPPLAPSGRPLDFALCPRSIWLRPDTRAQFLLGGVTLENIPRDTVEFRRMREDLKRLQIAERQGL